MHNNIALTGEKNKEVHFGFYYFIFFHIWMSNGPVQKLPSKWNDGIQNGHQRKNIFTCLYKWNIYMANIQRVSSSVSSDLRILAYHLHRMERLRNGMICGVRHSACQQRRMGISSSIRTAERGHDSLWEFIWWHLKGEWPDSGMNYFSAGFWHNLFLRRAGFIEVRSMSRCTSGRQNIGMWNRGVKFDQHTML